MVTASGKMMDKFIAGNGKKEKKKDMDLKRVQKEMNTTENRKTTR
jgi:hypothetical protein